MQLPKASIFSIIYWKIPFCRKGVTRRKRCPDRLSDWSTLPTKSPCTQLTQTGVRAVQQFCCFPLWRARLRIPRDCWTKRPFPDCLDCRDICGEKEPFVGCACLFRKWCNRREEWQALLSAAVREACSVGWRLASSMFYLATGCKMWIKCPQVPAYLWWLGSSSLCELEAAIRTS